MDEMYSIQPANTYPGEESFKRQRDYETQTNFGSRTSLTRFFEQNRDVVRNVCIVLALLLITNICTFASTKRNTTEKMQKIMDDKVAETAFVTRQETTEYLKQEYGINAENIAKSNREMNATYMAMALYPYIDNSDEGIYNAACCMENRKLSKYYPNDMHAVVSQNGQFMGWSEENPVVDRLYRIALDVEEIYDKTGAPMNPNYVYMNWSPKEIKLLDNMEKGQSTHTWYESDMEEYLKARNG